MTPTPSQRALPRARASRLLVLLALVVLLVASACGGDDPALCRDPRSPPPAGIVVADGATSFRYGSFVSGVNNDCSVPGAPVSITIDGTQLEAPSGFPPVLTLCVPRPDLLVPGAPFPVVRATPGVPTAPDVQLVTAALRSATCTYALVDVTAGEVTVSGLCTTDGASYGLELDLDITSSRTCGTVVDTVPLSITGDVDVLVN